MARQTKFQAPKPDYTRIAADAIWLHDYEVHEIINNSPNAVVYQGISVKYGEPVIFKQIPRSNVPSWIPLDGCWVPAEIAFHFAAYRMAQDFDLICKPIAWLEKSSSFVLVLEKLGGENCCDLFDLSKKYGALAEEPVKKIFRQLVNMWHSLNSSKICHCDLKDENIIIDVVTLECRLIDFGAATTLSSNEQTVSTGTRVFFPPEWFEYGTYTHQNLTAWTLGVILFILLTGQTPSQIKCNIEDFDIKEDAAHLLEHISEPACRLLKCLLEPEPSKRASYASTELLMKDWCN